MDALVFTAILAVVLLIVIVGYQYMNKRKGHKSPGGEPTSITFPSEALLYTLLYAKNGGPNEFTPGTDTTSTYYPLLDTTLTFNYVSTGLYKSNPTTAGTSTAPNLKVLSTVYYCVVVLDSAGNPFFIVTTSVDGTDNGVFYPGSGLTYSSSAGTAQCTLNSAYEIAPGVTSTNTKTGINPQAMGWLGCGVVAYDLFHTHNGVSTGSVVSFTGGATGTISDFQQFPGNFASGAIDNI